MIVFFLSKETLSQPFSYLDIGFARSSYNQLSDIYSDRWELSPVNSIQFRTPFYLGIAGAGIDFFTYTSNEDQDDIVSSINVSAYFGFNPINNKTFFLSSGFLVGVEIMEVPTEFFGSTPRETELFLGFSLEPQIRVNRFIIFSEFQYRRIFYYYRQNIFSIGGGVKVQFNVSDKIRGYID